MLASDDPSAGAEMFELRQLVQQVVAAAIAVRRACTVANARRVATDARPPPRGFGSIALPWPWPALARSGGATRR
jgi:hypothetical protein